MRSRHIVLPSVLMSLVSTFAFAQAPTATPEPSPAATAAPAPAPADASAIKVTPYGTVFFSGFSNSNATNNQDIPLWATSGPGNVGATVRGSRFGLKVGGAKVGKASLSGVIETDFFGGFPTIGIGDNMGVVRVRLANAKLDWTHTTLVLGQDWMVFAPVNPTSIACTGIPMMAASGNPWARIPQARLEQKWAHVLLQGAVLAPSTGDFSSTFLSQPGSGGLGRLPFAQGRLALKSWGAGKAGSVGVSGHIGRSRVIQGTSHTDVDTNAVGADLVAPIGKYVTLSGEAFTGKNLAGFQAGIFQGINPDFGVPPNPVPTPAPTGTPTAIDTKGGWAQLGVTLPGLPKVTFYVMGGVEDPDDDTLVSVTKRDWRLKNETFGGSFIHKLSPQFSWSAEVRHVKTKLLQTGQQDNTHINLAAAFSF